MNYAEQLCDVIPPMPEKPPEKPSEDDLSPNGEIIAAAIEKSKVIEVNQPPPFTRLPYSRASLRSPKDHAPKSHARVKIKNPEEEEFVKMGPLKTTSPLGAPDKQTMETQIFNARQAIEAWQKLVSAPYDKIKPRSQPNHF